MKERKIFKDIVEALFASSRVIRGFSFKFVHWDCTERQVLPQNHNPFHSSHKPQCATRFCAGEKRDLLEKRDTIVNLKERLEFPCHSEGYISSLNFVLLCKHHGLSWITFRSSGISCKNAVRVEVRRSRHPGDIFITCSIHLEHRKKVYSLAALEIADGLPPEWPPRYCSLLKIEEARSIHPSALLEHEIMQSWEKKGTPDERECAYNKIRSKASGIMSPGQGRRSVVKFKWRNRRINLRR